MFCLYTEARKSQICDHQYHDAKICASTIGFNENSLYLYCSGQEMPCSKDQYIEVECSKGLEVVQGLYSQVMKGVLFGFLQVDIHVPDDLKEKFSEFCLLLVVDIIPEETIPRHMKKYQERTG